MTRKLWVYSFSFAKSVKCAGCFHLPRNIIQKENNDLRALKFQIQVQSGSQGISLRSLNDILPAGLICPNFNTASCRIIILLEFIGYPGFFHKNESFDWDGSKN